MPTAESNSIKLNSNHLCLFDCAGEPIQQEAVPAGRRVQVLLDELHDHLITDLQANEDEALSH